MSKYLGEIKKLRNNLHDDDEYDIFDIGPFSLLTSD